MTPSYRKFLEQSRTCLRRILRKPAWDFNRFVADPRQAKGTAVAVPDADTGLIVRVLDDPGEFTGRRARKRVRL
jgi:hypothetical protein